MPKAGWMFTLELSRSDWRFSPCQRQRTKFTSGAGFRQTSWRSSKTSGASQWSRRRLCCEVGSPIRRRCWSGSRPALGHVPGLPLVPQRGPGTHGGVVPQGADRVRVHDRAGARHLRRAEDHGRHHRLSTTQVCSGSVIGVGAGRKLATVRWGKARRMVYGWLLTLPAAALFGAIAAAVALTGPVGVLIVLVALLAGAGAIYTISRRTPVTHVNVNDSPDVTVSFSRSSTSSMPAASSTMSTVATSQTVTLSGTAAATTPVETAPPPTGASAVITSTGTAPGSTAPAVVTPLVIGPDIREPTEDTICLLYTSPSPR